MKDATALDKAIKEIHRQRNRAAMWERKIRAHVSLKMPEASEDADYKEIMAWFKLMRSLSAIHYRRLERLYMASETTTDSEVDIRYVKT